MSVVPAPSVLPKKRSPKVSEALRTVWERPKGASQRRRVRQEDIGQERSSTTVALQVLPVTSQFGDLCDPGVQFGAKALNVRVQETPDDHRDRLALFHPPRL